MREGTEGLDVLYVTDHERDRSLVREFFSDVPDVRIVPADGPEGALERLADGEVDCVVSDHRPPAIEGLEFFERVREADPRVPFILFPSAGSERLAAAAVERGVTAYLPKDITFAEFGLLANQIRQAVEKVEAERELAATRARFRALAENTSAAVVSIDEGSTIRYANEGVHAVFGYEPEELVGESLLRVVPERLHDAHLEGISRYLDAGEKRLDWDWVELPGRHREGHEVSLGITFGETTIDGERLFTGVIRERAADGAADEPTDPTQMEPHG